MTYAKEILFWKLIMLPNIVKMINLIYVLNKAGLKGK